MPMFISPPHPTSYLPKLTNTLESCNVFKTSQKSGEERELVPASGCLAQRKTDSSTQGGLHHVHNTKSKSGKCAWTGPHALHKKTPQLLGQNSVQQCLLIKRKLEVRVKLFLF